MNSLTEIKAFLAELEKKEEGVTEGPWSYRERDGIVCAPDGTELFMWFDNADTGMPDENGDDQGYRDTRFAITSRTDLPKLRQMCQRFVEVVEKVSKLRGAADKVVCLKTIEWAREQAEEAIASIAGIIQKEGK